MKKILSIKNITLFLYFLFLFLIFIKNASRTVYGGDVGELVTASYVFGVAHPPGYPLFTILGIIFAYLPLLQETIVFKVGLISVISSVLAAILYYKIAYHFTKSFFISLLSTAILSFSYLFWFYAEIAEVFALNNLLTLIIFYLALLFYQKQKPKYYFLLVFFMALSSTHQHTIILIFPSIFLLLLARINFFLKNKRYILYSFIPLFLGFLPYLYVPIAASKSPVINWDKVHDIQSFLHLFLRKDYGTFKVEHLEEPSLAGKIIILKSYFTFFIFNITLPVFFICFLGILKIRKDLIKITALILGFVLSGPFFLWHAGLPLFNSFVIGMSERFYILSTIVFLIFLPYGFLFLKDFFNRFFSKKIYVYLIISSFLIIPIYLFKYNMPKTDLSKSTIGERFAFDILSTLPKNSVIFMDGDTQVFNTWYVKYVLKFREDVEVINISRMGNDEFISKQEAKFKSQNKNIKEKNKIFLGTLLKIKEKRPVFVIGEIESERKDIVWVPKGLLFELKYKKELTNKENYLKEIESIFSKMKIPYRNSLSIADRNLTISMIPQHYSIALLSTGSFLYLKYKDANDAIEFYKKAIEVDPNYAKPYINLGFLQYNYNKDCKNGELNIQKAIELNPSRTNYYVFMHDLYFNCYKDLNKAKKLRARFKAVFGKNIEEEIKKQSK